MAAPAPRGRHRVAQRQRSSCGPAPWPRRPEPRGRSPDRVAASAVASATSAPAGAVSAEKPEGPTTTEAPAAWVVPLSSVARVRGEHGVPPASREAPRDRGRRARRRRWAGARCTGRGGAPSAVRTWPSLGDALAGQAGEAGQDAGRAEAALARPRAPRTRSTSRPSRTGSRPSRVVTASPGSRRTGVTQATRATPSMRTVQQPHWPWGLQPSLRRAQPELAAERVEEGPLGGELDASPVELDRDGGRLQAPSPSAQLKEEPQPQVRDAFGFVMWNPASSARRSSRATSP